MITTQSFWQLPAWSKLDKLDETRHAHFILEALQDTETGVMVEQDGSIIIHGDREGLLVYQPSLSLFLILCLYSAFMSILYPSSSTR